MPRASQTDHKEPAPAPVVDAAIQASAPPDPYRWQPMNVCPKNRPVFLTPDTHDDEATVLSFWKTTRTRVRGQWKPEQYWARVMDHRKVPFEPTAWREASAPSALQYAHEADQQRAVEVVRLAEKQRRVETLEHPDEPAEEPA